ncbi:DUF2231 domain-containing protein [Tomitella cavernea]|uniref:DUF2231 domain-containing protein n=1 Tax=Tomitella cavernea TaxID=1387982 RepID=A0ABP9C1H4_9ACTN|nr:DUF2231 domain-containing protein [Tomitella cavernea]
MSEQIIPTEYALQAKQPVSAVLTGPYGHPFHPILVTIPIGTWAASLVFDIGSFIVGDPDFLNKGAAWLIAVGVLGALAAATVGFLDLLAIPTGTKALRTGLTHMSLMLAVTVGFALDFWWRTASGLDGTVGTGPLVLTIVCLVVLVAAGALGGKLAYRYGVRVVDECTQADGFRR